VLCFETLYQTCTPVPYVDAARHRKFAVLTINSDLPYPDHMRVRQAPTAGASRAGDSRRGAPALLELTHQALHQREDFMRRLGLYLWDSYVRYEVVAASLL